MEVGTGVGVDDVVGVAVGVTVVEPWVGVGDGFDVDWSLDHGPAVDAGPGTVLVPASANTWATVDASG